MHPCTDILTIGVRPSLKIHPSPSISPDRDAFAAENSSLTEHFSWQGCIRRWKFIPHRAFFLAGMHPPLEIHPSLPNPQKAPCCRADQISRDDIPRIMNAPEDPDSCNTGGEQQEYHAQENILPENTH